MNSMCSVVELIQLYETIILPLEGRVLPFTSCDILPIFHVTENYDFRRTFRVPYLLLLHPQKALIKANNLYLL